MITARGTFPVRISIHSPLLLIQVLLTVKNRRTRDYQPAFGGQIKTSSFDINTGFLCGYIARPALNMSVPSTSNIPDFLSEPSLATLQQALPAITTASVVFVALISFFVFTRKSRFPVANAPAWFEPTILKRLEYLKDGYMVYERARKQYGSQPFKLISNSADMIVLPVKYANVLRSDSRFTFGKTVIIVSKSCGTSPTY
jgi:hypothetical protein